MINWHRWIPWLLAALYGAPIVWRAFGLGTYPLAGQRGLVADLSISVPVALLAVSGALVLTLDRWRTVASCFMLSGALMATSFGLLMYVKDSAALGLVSGATLLAFEARRQQEVQQRAALSSAKQLGHA